MARLVAVLLAVSLVAACASGGSLEGRVIDGWHIGMVSSYCSGNQAVGPNEAPCQVQLDQMMAVATARLDQRDPGHAAVVRAALYDLGPYMITRTRVPEHVVVFSLADGSLLAIGLARYPEFPNIWQGQDYGTAAAPAS